MKYFKSQFKSIYLLFLILILFLCISLSAFCQGQILSDEGFENCTSNGTFPDSGYWLNSDAGGGADAGCTNTAKHNGNNGLWEYTGNETWATWSGPYQEFPVSPGEVYQASAWIRTPSADAGGSWVVGSKACLRIVFLNSSKSVIVVSESSGVTNIGSSWTQYSVMTAPAPQDAGSHEPQLRGPLPP